MPQFETRADIAKFAERLEQRDELINAANNLRWSKRGDEDASVAIKALEDAAREVEKLAMAGGAAPTAGNETAEGVVAAQAADAQAAAGE